LSQLATSLFGNLTVHLFSMNDFLLTILLGIVEGL